MQLEEEVEQQEMVELERMQILGNRKVDVHKFGQEPEGKAEMGPVDREQESERPEELVEQVAMVEIV